MRRMTAATEHMQVTEALQVKIYLYSADVKWFYSLAARNNTDRGI